MYTLVPVYTHTFMHIHTHTRTRIYTPGRQRGTAPTPARFSNAAGCGSKSACASWHACTSQRKLLATPQQGACTAGAHEQYVVDGVWDMTHS